MSYDPRSVNLICGGVVVSGYADGSFIKVKRNKDLYTQKVGRDDVIDVRSTDRTGTISVTLLAASNTNDVFSALLELDEASPYGTMSIPLLVKDANGSTLMTGTGRLKGWPEVEFSMEESHREWVFNVSNLKFFVGGHN